MKYIKQLITKRNLLFISIFTIIGFIALQIPVTQVVGSKVKFTVYDAFAPIAGSFIGSVPGITAVFFMQFLNFLLHGAKVVDAGTIVRFFPMLFAVAYFSRKGKLNFIIPSIAMAAFILHPVGRSVWYFSLFWTIPIFAYFFRERFLFLRALGSTFTAHAVGSTLWLWTFSLPVSAWNSLIPVVFLERFLFAIGISASFIFVNNLIYFLEKKHLLNLGLYVEQKYLIPNLRESHNIKT